MESHGQQVSISAGYGKATGIFEWLGAMALPGLGAAGCGAVAMASNRIRRCGRCASCDVAVLGAVVVGAGCDGLAVLGAVVVSAGCDGYRIGALVGGAGCGWQPYWGAVVGAPAPMAWPYLARCSWGRRLRWFSRIGRWLGRRLRRFYRI